MRARAPASSANLGPGFDALAVAVDRYIEVEVEPASKLFLHPFGEGSDIAHNAMNLAAQVAMDVAGTSNLSITVRSQIPVGRGLGSSAALAAAAAAAAGSKDPLAVAAKVDGHPENAAASVVGGLVAATVIGGSVRVVRLPLDPTLVFVVMVPDRTLATSRARQVLPAQIPRENASFNLGRMALLLAGLGDATLLIPEAMQDRLHQDYRSPLFPEAPHLLKAFLEAGALASCWSGAGPSLLGVCRDDRAEHVRTEVGAAMARAAVPGRVMVLHPDLGGLIVGEHATLPTVAPLEVADPSAALRRLAARPRPNAEPPSHGGVFDFDA